MFVRSHLFLKTLPVYCSKDIKVERYSPLYGILTYYGSLLDLTEFCDMPLLPSEYIRIVFSDMAGVTLEEKMPESVIWGSLLIPIEVLQVMLHF